MRALLAFALFGAVGCSNDVSPRLIAGGGVGDGEIDGEVNVYVIDESTDAPIAGATVSIGDKEKTTDAKGLAVFSDVEGKQTIAAKYMGYRSSVWVGVNGANVTMNLKPHEGMPESATLSGTIAGWSAITLGAGHIKAAVTFYSQTDNLGDKANNFDTPNNANICFGAAECNWTIVTRTGSVTLVALIVDRDTKNTIAEGDDTYSIVGYAYQQGIVVVGGVNQSGIVLDQIEAGNLETVTVDQGTPPAGLPELFALPGIEIGDDEVVQMLALAFFLPDATEFLVPKRTVFGADGTYRLTAVAQTASGDMGAQSIILRQGLTTPDLATGTWLVPPVNVDITRTTASWDTVTGAKVHSVNWKDAVTGDELLEISAFEAKTTEVEVPNAVALPPSGMLSARVNAIGADFDVNDFSLDDDSSKLWGISAQPTTIP